MKKILLILCFISFSICSFGQNLKQHIRIAIGCDHNFPQLVKHMKDDKYLSLTDAEASVHVNVPRAADIYLGLTPVGKSNGVIVTPLFLTEDNKTLIDFSFVHPCYAGNRTHTLLITNSNGYDKKVPVTNFYHFNDVIPLDPSGSTTISIIFMY